MTLFGQGQSSHKNKFVLTLTLKIGIKINCMTEVGLNEETLQILDTEITKNNSL